MQHDDHVWRRKLQNTERLFKLQDKLARESDVLDAKTRGFLSKYISDQLTRELRRVQP